MIRVIRPNAMAQDDASLISGWNVAPNLAYTLLLLPSASSCGVLLYDDDASTLIASGAALTGTEQPCVLIPQAGQSVGMIDADLGWHLLLTTTGTESQRTIRIGPAVDLPDEIHPVYGDDDMALARATAAIDAAAHYIDDVTVTCPLGLGAGLGGVVSVPVDGSAVVGEVESITWTATPDGTSEQAVIRRHVAIAPESFVEITPPTVADDTGTATHTTGASGNVLTNDESGLTVVAVNGLSGNVGIAVDGDNGGLFTIGSDGAWTFDPAGDFSALTGSETADTSVTYHASDGVSEAMGTLTVTVSAGDAPELWTPAEITTALWLDAADSGTITLNGSTVSQWSDKSGNDRHATQATTSKQPTNGGTFNDTNALSFDGGDVLETAELFESSSSVGMMFAAVDHSSGTNRTIMSTRQASTNNGWSWRINSASEVTYFHTGYTPSITATRNSGKNILGIVRNGLSVAHSVDGTLGSASNISGFAASGYNKTAIGAENSGTASYFLGLIGEIVVSGSVDTTTRQKIEGYLAHKWGLSANLPSDHPYKSAAPTI